MKLLSEGSTAKLTPASSALSSINQRVRNHCIQQLYNTTPPTPAACDCKARLFKSVCWKSASLTSAPDLSSADRIEKDKQVNRGFSIPLCEVLFALGTNS